MILTVKSEKSRRYPINRKQPVYVHRLKKVTHASRESIRILSEIFAEPLKNFPHFPETKSAAPAGSGCCLKPQTGANRAIKKQIESHRANQK